MILHRQHGINRRCLRADAGFSRQCDQPYPGVPQAANGNCPIFEGEGAARDVDAWIQAQTILRNCGRDPMDALRLEERR